MRGIKKSRHGCALCKSKRLKCDESQPSCGRCTRLGLQCPGYSQSLRWVTKHEVLKAPSRKTTPLISENKSVASSPQIPDTGSVVVSHAASNPPNDRKEISFDEQAPSLNEVSRSLGIEHFDRQFSMTLPELEHLDTPPPTTILNVSDSDKLSEEAFAPFQNNQTILYSGISSCVDSSDVSSLTPRTNSQPGRFSILPRLRRPLEDPSSSLIEYYFKEVAGLFSSYDSHMNPFRTTVSRLWTSSPAMCRTLQSMAAATLVDDFPQFGPLGLKMRKEAISMLESQESLDDKSLLAMLMLGQTASWHDATDLGISFFNTLRSHLNSPAIGGSILKNHNNYQFFEEALIYWEMLLSYVADHDALNSSAMSRTANDRLLTQQVPHPWTGIARDTQFLVNKVGRLVRRERERVRRRRFTSQRDVTKAQEAIQESQQLEERLLNLAHPAEADVVNPGDDETPVWHLLAMAEVYRFTGLIQLYRVFPDLLCNRLRVENMPSKDPPSSGLPSSLLHQADDPLTTFLDIPDFFAPEDFNLHESPHNGSNEAEDIPEDEQKEYLTTIALMAMSRLKTIPFESRTRCLQPFLLVAASSELRLPPTGPELPTLDCSGVDYSLNLSAHAIEVSRTRKFILGRLSSLLHVLPPKPIHICVELVQEVWRRMDAGESDVYWMDVMIDNGWETTMG